MSDQPTDDRPIDEPPARVRRPRATTAGRPRATSRPAEAAGDAPPTKAAGEPISAEDASASVAPVSRATATDLITTDDATSAGRGVGPPEAVEIRWGGIGRSDAEDVAVTWGGVGLARAKHVSVELGGLGLGIAEEIRVTQAVASTVVGERIDLEQCLSRVVIGGRVTFRRASGALVVLAGRTDGEIRTLLDWRGALAFGAAAGLAMGLGRLLRRGD